jgi:hypothetical protein
MSDSQTIVSDTNRTPVVQIITWMALVISALAVTTHAGITYYTSRAVKLDTYLVVLSLVGLLVPAYLSKLKHVFRFSVLRSPPLYCCRRRTVSGSLQIHCARVNYMLY